MLRFMAVLAGLCLALGVAGCSSGGGDSASTTSEATTTTAPGGLSGTWAVTFRLQSAVDAQTNTPLTGPGIQQTFDRVWTFTADGCEGGDAGCVTVSDPATPDDEQQFSVRTTADGFQFDTGTLTAEALCGEGLSGEVVGTFDFQRTDGQLTGTYHEVGTPDDPSRCHGARGSYQLSASPADESSTTTTAAGGG